MYVVCMYDFKPNLKIFLNNNQLSKLALKNFYFYTYVNAKGLTFVSLSVLKCKQT